MLELRLNRFQKTTWKTLIFMLFMCQISTGFGADLNPPKLTFKYGAIYDLDCGSMTTAYFEHEKMPGIDYHTEIMKEASSLTSTLQKQWDEQGQELVSKLINIVGREYSKDDLIVYSSGCLTGGMSTPLIVGIKHHLKNVRKNPTSISGNVLLTFHEFIHVYLTESFDYGRSEVLKEFSEEPALFKNHLHLMALMNQSLILSGLEDLSSQYAKTLRGEYKKAWEISMSDNFQMRLINEVQTLEGNNNNFWFFDSFLME